MLSQGLHLPGLLFSLSPLLFVLPVPVKFSSYTPSRFSLPYHEFIVFCVGSISANLILLCVCVGVCVVCVCVCVWACVCGVCVCVCVCMCVCACVCQ